MRVTFDTAAIRISALVLVVTSTWALYTAAGQRRSGSTASPAAQPAATVQRAAIVGPTRNRTRSARRETDSVDAYYGVQTARAVENFRISGVAINHYPGFVEAWAIVKLAAARANTDVGAMKPEKLAAIEKAAAALMNGK
jgi:aspartate ammonia-lyase